MIFSIFLLALSFVSASQAMAVSQLEELECCAEKVLINVVDKRTPYELTYARHRLRGFDVELPKNGQHLRQNLENGSFQELVGRLKDAHRSSDGTWNLAGQDGQRVTVQEESDLGVLLIFEGFSHHPSFKVHGVTTVVIDGCAWLSNFVRSDLFPDVTDFHVMNVSFCWSHMAPGIRHVSDPFRTQFLFFRADAQAKDCFQTVFKAADPYTCIVSSEPNEPYGSFGTENSYGTQIFLSKSGQSPCDGPGLAFKATVDRAGVYVPPLPGDKASVASPVQFSSQEESSVSDDLDWSASLKRLFDEAPPEPTNILDLPIGTWGVVASPVKSMGIGLFKSTVVTTLRDMYENNQSAILSDISLSNPESGVTFDVTQTITVKPLWPNKSGQLVGKPPLASRESAWTVSSQAIEALTPKAFRLDLAWRLKDNEASSSPLLSAGPVIVTTKAFPDDFDPDQEIVSDMMKALGICEFDQIMNLPRATKQSSSPSSKPRLEKDDQALEDPCENHTPAAGRAGVIGRSEVL